MNKCSNSTLLRLTIYSIVRCILALSASGYGHDIMERAGSHDGHMS